VSAQPDLTPRSHTTQNTKYKEKGEMSKVVNNYVDFFDASKGFTEEERKANYETVREGGKGRVGVCMCVNCAHSPLFLCRW
jgi:hypothetical protein